MVCEIVSCDLTLVGKIAQVSRRYRQIAQKIFESKSAQNALLLRVWTKLPLQGRPFPPCRNILFRVAPSQLGVLQQQELTRLVEWVINNRTANVDSVLLAGEMYKLRELLAPYQQHQLVDKAIMKPLHQQVQKIAYQLLYQVVHPEIKRGFSRSMRQELVWAVEAVLRKGFHHGLHQSVDEMMQKLPEIAPKEVISQKFQRTLSKMVQKAVSVTLPASVRNGFPGLEQRVVQQVMQETMHQGLPQGIYTVMTELMYKIVWQQQTEGELVQQEAHLKGSELSETTVAQWIDAAFSVLRSNQYLFSSSICLEGLKEASKTPTQILLRCKSELREKPYPEEACIRFLVTWRQRIHEERDDPEFLKFALEEVLPRARLEQASISTTVLYWLASILRKIKQDDHALKICQEAIAISSTLITPQARFNAIARICKCYPCQEVFDEVSLPQMNPGAIPDSEERVKMLMDWVEALSHSSLEQELLHNWSLVESHMSERPEKERCMFFFRLAAVALRRGAGTYSFYLKAGADIAKTRNLINRKFLEIAIDLFEPNMIRDFLRLVDEPAISNAMVGTLVGKRKLELAYELAKEYDLLRTQVFFERLWVEGQEEILKEEILKCLPGDEKLNPPPLYVRRSVRVNPAESLVWVQRRLQTAAVTDTWNDAYSQLSVLEQLPSSMERAMEEAKLGAVGAVLHTVRGLKPVDEQCFALFRILQRGLTQRLSP